MFICLLVLLPADGAKEFRRRCYFHPDVFIYVQRHYHSIIPLLRVIYLHSKRSLPRGY